MNNRVLWAMAAASALGSCGAGWADELVIGGFNAGRGGALAIAGGGNLDDLRASIVAHYPETIFVGTSTLTPAFLGGVDILFLVSATGNTAAIQPLTSEEQSALLSFIRNGGTAVLCVENDSFAGSASDPANESLVDALGLDVVGTGGAWPQSATVLDPANSPLTNGPFGTVSGWTVGWSGWFDYVPGSAVVLATIDQSGLPGLIVFPRHAISACSGVTVAFSDSSAFGDSWFTPGSANDILMLNTIHYASQPSCTAGVCGDIDADAAVGSTDLALLLGAWGTSDAMADLDGDGEVGAADLAILLGNWGPCDTR